MTEEIKEEEEKEEKPVKGSFVTVNEIVEMKAMKLKEFSVAEIARKSGRNRKTVERSLAIFEKMLPDSVDMKNRVMAKFEEMQEQMMKNAKNICFSADLQVMRKIDTKETSAMEAAKIRQIYGSELMRLSGLGGGPEGDDHGNSPKVQKFITTIINIQQIQKDDTPRPTTRTEGATGGDVRRGEENCVEGVVLE